MSDKNVEKVKKDENSDMNELDTLVAKAKAAQLIYSKFTQEQVDAIFKAAATAANVARIPLAKMAAEETGRGIAEDKVIKNHFASEYIYNKYKNTKTCDVIEEDIANGMRKVAEPIGVIAGIIPTTNPTSTAIFKTLITLKTRNAIVISPHPAAKKSTAAAAKIVNDAAVAAGAPEGLIHCIAEPTVPLSAALMNHNDVSIILATGGPGMVKQAYSCGKPALGVGAGNTPAIIDSSADIKMAVSSILMSKTFDNGMICASEQTVVVVDSIYEEVKKEFAYRGAYILNAREKEAVGKTIVVDGHLNAPIVGKPAAVIAEMAGIKVPENAKVLMGEAEEVSPNEPFSYEKLSPVLGLYRGKDFDEVLDKAHKLVEFGGLGHTSVLYVNESTEKEKVEKFYKLMPTGRTLINTPASQGAIGDIFNFRLNPSLTLGCGSWGKNAVSENVGVMHLLNIKSVASRRENMLWFRVPPKIYFKRGCTELALGDYAGRKRAMIITDKFLHESGNVLPVVEMLERIGMQVQVFSDVTPDPTLTTVRKGLEVANSFKPDLMVAFGGGSPIDAGKIIWLQYEQPEIKFEDVAMRFMDIRKRICELPELGKVAHFVAIATSSGTGSETTPFAVITDDTTGIKYPLADYALTPNMAILDADFVMSMPKGLASASGIDVLTHALESYVAITATEFTQPYSLKATKLIFDYLPTSYETGDETAREKVHYASALAGMAFANGMLGVCHSMAHKLGNAFHVPHGVANAMLICQVIRLNANDTPLKQGIFSQYHYPEGKKRYAEIADHLGLGGKTDDEKVTKLVEAVNKLKTKVGIPLAIKDWKDANGNQLVTEEAFNAKLDELVEMAFDDQCTGANPAYPLFKEIKQMYLDAYNGVC